MLFVNDFLTDQTILRSNHQENNPLVSIVLPTYCRGKTGQLKNSITSIISQTFQDFELLVIDDGSSDGSYDLIEEFRAKDPRVVHVRHERNSGIHSIRLNEGMALASGKYIAFQFDDDLWTPNALEALTNEILKHTNPVMVIGHSWVTGLHGKWNIPIVEVNMINLLEQNRFANNSVLFPRILIEQYGMYDCHIGMRRLCDWDLWLRYIKRVPFIVIDTVVSQVFESNPHSLGVTVPYDLSLFRFMSDIQRNHLLTPERWNNYSIDSLTIGEVEIPKAFRKRLYEDQIVPYYFKFRHHFPQIEGFQATLPDGVSKTVIYTRQSYDTTFEVALGNYDTISSKRRTYKGYYQPLSQIPKNWSNETDILVLNRVVEDDGQQYIDEALNNNIPIAYYLDDDLVYFYEYGPKYNYIAPGTPFHNNLKNYLAQVDTVITTNEAIASSVRPYNARIIYHNGSVLDEYLQSMISPRLPEKTLKIGYVGSSYRIDEFKFLWDAFFQLSKEYSDEISFEFWGMDINQLPPLACPTSQREFIFNYPLYLNNLSKAKFDILLTPLFDYPRPRLAKSYNKYYETAVAGALGIFSDVPQYQRLLSDLTCLKAKNTSQSWYETIKHAIEMPYEEFDAIRTCCLEHVREEFSTTGQIHYHEAALRATELHGKTRQFRHKDGRPRVVYVLHSASFGGAEILLWRRLHLAREYGIEPVIFLPLVTRETENGRKMKYILDQEGISVEFIAYSCFTEPCSPNEYFSEYERKEIRSQLENYKPALVHSITFIPSLGQICDELTIPHICTEYAIEDNFTWKINPSPFNHCQIVQSDSFRYANRWSQLLHDTPKVVARDMTPIELFDLGQKKFLQQIKSFKSKDKHSAIQMVVAGTFQPRKQQLETIEAIGELVNDGYDCNATFFGYTHFFPEYVEKCRQTIERLNLLERVSIKEFTTDLVSALDKVDILLSVSTYESLPGAIRDAFAAGVLVVATPVGGVKELVIDNISGILCQDTSVEAIREGISRAIALSSSQREIIIQQARKVARSEAHPYRTANDLMYMYNLVIDKATEKNEYKFQHKLIPNEENVSALPAPRLLINPIRPPLSAVQVGSGLIYHINPEYNNWEGLDVLVGTHMQTVKGILELTISTTEGVHLRKVSIDLNHARDNDWLAFHFPPIFNSSQNTFQLDFSLRNISPGTKISIYETNPQENRVNRLLRKVVRTSGFQIKRSGLYYRHSYHD